MSDPTSAAEVRAEILRLIDRHTWASRPDANGKRWVFGAAQAVDAILADPVLGPRLLGQQGGEHPAIKALCRIVAFAQNNVQVPTTQAYERIAQEGLSACGRLLGQQGGDAGEALERAARIAENGCLVPPDGGSPTEDERLMCEGIAAAIRALSAPQPAPGLAACTRPEGCVCAYSNNKTAFLSCTFAQLPPPPATNASPVQAGSAAPADLTARLAAVQAERDQAVATIQRLRDALSNIEAASEDDRIYDLRAVARAALASSTSIGTGESS